MKTSLLRFQIHLPVHTNLTKSSNLIPTKSTSYPKHPTISTSRITTKPTKPMLHTSKRCRTKKPQLLGLKRRSQNYSRNELFQISSNGYSRAVILGAVSVGFVLALMGIEDQKAWALGPEGPLMEEFWDNVRRYAIYALTVSTGALYTIFQPIYELLKNPISAILILVILGGSIFVVSQVLNAMVGVSDFTYDYGY